MAANSGLLVTVLPSKRADKTSAPLRVPLTLPSRTPVKELSLTTPTTFKQKQTKLEAGLSP
jgi:hypothetical protein